MRKLDCPIDVKRNVSSVNVLWIWWMGEGYAADESNGRFHFDLKSQMGIKSVENVFILNWIHLFLHALDEMSIKTCTINPNFIEVWGIDPLSHRSIRWQENWYNENNRQSKQVRVNWYPQNKSYYKNKCPLRFQRHIQKSQPEGTQVQTMRF